MSTSRSLRRENATAFEKAKTDAVAAAEAAASEITQRLGKALGLVKDDELVDPEALLKQAQAERQFAIDEANATKRDLAVLRNADKHDANVEELLESVSFGRKLPRSTRPPTTSHPRWMRWIKDAVDGNPAKFKRVQVATSTGAPSTRERPHRSIPRTKSIEQLREERRKRRGL